jgi:hypothetical protein
LYRQALSHDIRELMQGWHMENTSFTKDLLTDEVNVDLNVLGLVVMDGFCCHVYSTDVVKEDNSG